MKTQATINHRRQRFARQKEVLGGVLATALLSVPGTAWSQSCTHPAGAVSMDLLGDVDGSGHRNVSDVMCSILCSLAYQVGTPLSQVPCLADASVFVDVSCDGVVNLTDVMTVIHLSFGLPVPSPLQPDPVTGCPQSCAPCHAEGQQSCLISGTCVPEDDLNPNADCEACYPDLATMGWSQANDLTPCEGGAKVCLGGTCSQAEPDAPSGVTAQAGDTKVHISFTPPAYIGGGAITGYEVEVSPGATIVSGMSSPITVAGLTNGVPYIFRVRAENSYGYSVWSDASDESRPDAVPRRSRWKALRR